MFGVNWLLLASIHMQETAFSTAPSTYQRPELRPLLRGADAVQRHQWAGEHVGSGEERLPLWCTPRGVRPSAPPATRRSTTTTTRSWRRRGCCTPTAPAARSKTPRGGRRMTTTATTHTAWNTPTGARPRDRLVPARLLHQLRRAAGAGAGRLRRLRCTGDGDVRECHRGPRGEYAQSAAPAIAVSLPRLPLSPVAASRDPDCCWPAAGWWLRSVAPRTETPTSQQCRTTHACRLFRRSRTPLFWTTPI